MYYISSKNCNQVAQQKLLSKIKKIFGRKIHLVKDLFFLQITTNKYGNLLEIRIIYWMNL